MIAHPDYIDQTHVAVSHYQLGPYWFLRAIPRGELVTEAKSVWWASYAGDWVRREGYDSLEDAMIAAADFGRSKKPTT